MPAGSLLRVLAGGGAPAPVTRIPRPESGQHHSWPAFLPDGKHFLYFMDWSSPGDLKAMVSIWVLSILGRQSGFQS